MLNDYKKNIKNIKIEKLNTSIKWITFKKFIWENRLKIIIVIGILLLIFFPLAVGTFIGTWIDKFIGSLIQNIQIF